MRRILITAGLLITGLSAFGQGDKARRYFAKGYYMIDQRNYPAAIESFLKAIEIDSTGNCGTGMKGKAHGELAYAYLRGGDTTKAATYFEKSIALDPTNPFPRQNKAVMLSMQNKNDEAYQTLEELIEIRPDWIEAYVQRGFLYEDNDKHELAILDFKKALELNEKAKILPPNLIDDLKKAIKGKKKK